MRNTGKGLSRRLVAMYIVATAIRVSGLSADGRCPAAVRADDFDAVKKTVLRGHTIKEFGNKSRIRCAKLCADNDRCRSFNHDKTDGTCQLNDGRHVDFPGDLQQDENWSYYYINEELKPKFKPSWPSGSYGLPMPVAGCPTADGFTWETGCRFHDTDSENPGNRWSAGLHLKGPYLVEDMNQHFCMKTLNRVGHSEPEVAWPQGQYCVFKYGDHCQANMTSGSIYWNDENDDNINRGTVPSGQYDQDMSRIDYCCMTRGSASQPIALPTGSPFYLFPYTAECQQVQGMIVSQEWFYWDCVGSQTAPVGSHPLYKSDGNNHCIYYCYYQAFNINDIQNE